MNKFDQLMVSYLFSNNEKHYSILIASHQCKSTASKNERKCRIASNLHQTNSTLNISTDFVLQPPIETNCK